MKFDTNENGLLTLFKPNQAALLEYIWGLNSHIRTDISSAQAYRFMQTTGDRELMKSRASVIFSLDDRVDDGILITRRSRERAATAGSTSQR